MGLPGIVIIYSASLGLMFPAHLALSHCFMDKELDAKTHHIPYRYRQPVVCYFRYPLFLPG